ncbi:uncharacterized protein LOC143425432 [Xylocopa sonorina]|uniref:uncharacterized protein LOC143425432 n=1 Tax=Xylocopa sonorina TaxID=1818115 RepID=UPI00403B28F3
MDYFPGKEIVTSYCLTIGWYLIAILISFWFASPYIRAKYTSWKQRKYEEEYAAKHHKNPDLLFLQERLSALEASRQKMQEEYYEKCALVQQEGIRKGRAKKVSRLIIGNNSSIGCKLGSKGNDRSSFTGSRHRSLKDDYSPLMGDGSRGYRPPKRTCCGKGNCG